MNLKFTKFRFYLKGAIKGLIPRGYLRRKLPTLLNVESKSDFYSIKKRVDYYNKLETSLVIESNAKTYHQYSMKDINSTYYFDFKELIRYFDIDLKFHYLFGDINYTSDKPAFVKSRPIDGDNKNSVVLKLDKLRHFYFINDKIPFEDKKSVAVFRGPCYQTHRQIFIQQTLDVENTNIKDTRKISNKSLSDKLYMSKEKQLEYKFIISVEGNDVATNLKWIMSSNSLCFMRKPKFETWFMEGILIPNHHYVLLNDDYSNLSESINYYTKNTNKALEIIQNANDYTKQFLNFKNEKIISILVIEKYFRLSGQIKSR